MVYAFAKLNNFSVHRIQYTSRAIFSIQFQYKSFGLFEKPSITIQSAICKALLSRYISYRNTANRSQQITAIAIDIAIASVVTFI